jgi:uncharacterized membrane protein
LTDFGSVFGADFNYGSQADRAGRVVGTADVAGDVAAHGFVWDRGNIVQELGPLPSDQVSWALDINNSGIVVGASGLADWPYGPPAYYMLCPCYGVIWQNGQVTRLNDLMPPGWTMDLAEDINDQGEILGFGTHNGGYQEFLLKPVINLSSERLNQDQIDPDQSTRSRSFSGPTRISRDREGKLSFVWRRR